jgi:hypothetical protein
MMGTTTAEVVALAVEQGAAAVGANCGTSLENMGRSSRSSPPPPALPLWVKPNAGLPRMLGDSAVYDVTPEDLAQAARDYVAAGARVVGGCCGSTPARARHRGGDQAPVATRPDHASGPRLAASADAKASARPRRRARSGRARSGGRAQRRRTGLDRDRRRQLDG